MAAPMDENAVELGFLEKSDDWRLLSHHFPSKVGGKPAWLSLKPLPKPDELSCEICGKPTQFLIQVYAPVSEKDECFHRTLFLFVCKNPSCDQKHSSKNFKVFRSQLQRINNFYSSEPPDEVESECPVTDHPNASKYQNICIVCGGLAPKSCSKCHVTHYCGKDHQTIDWKSGHKSLCGTAGYQGSSANHVFPEFDLVTEPEDFKPEKKEEKSETEKMKDYTKFLKSKTCESDEKFSGKEVERDLAKMAFSDDQEDKAFKKFKKRVQMEPQQVMRYQRGGEPLLVSSEHVPTAEDIPKCDCGAARTFEFQVLPQLLNHLDVTDVEKSLDWGTLLVYTCSADCDIQTKYHQEFIWKQDFSEDSL